MVIGCAGQLCANGSNGQSSSKWRRRVMPLLSMALNPRYPHALRGIGLMVLAVSTFPCLDTTSKYLAQHYPVPAIVCARYVVQMLLMVAVLAPRMGMRLLQTSNLKLQIIRGVVLTASSLVFLSAPRLMPLAEAASIAFMTPIIIAARADLDLEPLHVRPTADGAAPRLAGVRPAARRRGARRHGDHRRERPAADPRPPAQFRTTYVIIITDVVRNS